jgi:hypothetical protein
MISDEIPFLRLVIDSSAKGEVEPNSAPVWNPEDNLRGHLQLFCSAEDAPVLEKITVYFEGQSITSIFHLMTVNE